MNRIKVSELMNALKSYNPDMDVVMDLRAGGGISLERRDLVDDRTGEAREIIAIFGSNGGSFGYPALSEDYYKNKSFEILQILLDGYKSQKRITTIHGGYRIYTNYGGRDDSCYGTTVDPRIIMRMKAESLICEVRHPNYPVRVEITDIGATAITKGENND